MSVSRVSAEPDPKEGVGPVHSREVPLPLTRDEIGTPLTAANVSAAAGFLFRVKETARTVRTQFSEQSATIRDGERGGVLPWIEPAYRSSQAVAKAAKRRQSWTDEASQSDKSWLKASAL